MVTSMIHNTEKWASEFYPENDESRSFAVVRLSDKDGNQTCVFYNDIESIQNHIAALVDLMHKMEDGA